MWPMYYTLLLCLFWQIFIKVALGYNKEVESIHPSQNVSQFILCGSLFFLYHNPNRNPLYFCISKNRYMYFILPAQFPSISNTLPRSIPYPLAARAVRDNIEVTIERITKSEFLQGTDVNTAGAAWICGVADIIMICRFWSYLKAGV